MCRLRIYAMRAPQIVRNAYLYKQVFVFIHQEFESRPSYYATIYNINGGRGLTKLEFPTFNLYLIQKHLYKLL